MEGSPQALPRGLERKTYQKFRQPSIQIRPSFLITFVGGTRTFHPRVGVVSPSLPSLPKPASYAPPNARSTPGAIVLSITYGIDIKSTDDKFLNANVEASHALATVLVPGKFLADTIPICTCLCIQTVTYKRLTNPLIVRYLPDWFPGTGFKALAKEARDKFKVSIDAPLEYVKNTMKVRPRSSLRSDCGST